MGTNLQTPICTIVFIEPNFCKKIVDRNPTMLYEFLQENQKQILDVTEKKFLVLVGALPTSNQLKAGLPIFFQQLWRVLKAEAFSPIKRLTMNTSAVANATQKNDEQELVFAEGPIDDAKLAKSASLHGQELLRLGYTLSHVIHAYGSMCQAITELASEKNAKISAGEFHDFNRCLDIAIAGAVTAYQAQSDVKNSHREIEHLGSLSHELRNALGTMKLSYDLIKEGQVGFSGSVGKIMDQSLIRMETLIERSLTEVRLRVDSAVKIESINLLKLVNLIYVTAAIEARQKKQILEVQIDPGLVVNADQQLLYSILFNLIQNALKYSRAEGKIQVRAYSNKSDIIVEVEDECGGLSNTAIDLFKPFEQQNENKSGLGLGLSITQKAVHLIHGKIAVNNRPKNGCVFKLTLPQSKKMS